MLKSLSGIETISRNLAGMIYLLKSGKLLETSSIKTPTYPLAQNYHEQIKVGKELQNI